MGNENGKIAAILVWSVATEGRGRGWGQGASAPVERPRVLTVLMLASVAGAVVNMEHFQPALDPRKQELLEMRFTGAKVGGDG